MSGSLASPPKKHPSVLRRFDEARMLPDHTNLPKPNQKTAALLRPKAGVATVKHSAASTLVGFNASFLQFANEAGVSLAMTAKDVHDSSRPTLSTVNMLDQLSIDTLSSRRTETKSLVELRNYTSQMDNFTSQTFVIYGGQAVKESPEFVDFKRDYASDFGCIAGLVTRLEEILRNHGVKHAVISCKEIHKIAQLSLNYIPEADLLKCIVNLEQIQPQLNKKRMYGHNMRARAAVKIQSYIRKRRAVINYKRLTIEAKAAVYLQSNFRTVIQRVRMVSHYHGLRALEDKRLKANQLTLRNSWSGVPSDKRLIIHVPSVSCDEYLRQSMGNIRHVHAMHISCLWQLANPLVHVVFVCAIYFGNDIIDYYERFLAMIGIPTFPRRFHFIVPEAISASAFPQHSGLSSMLWYSSVALNRIKYVMKSFNEAIIVPSALSSVEKRLVGYLNCPILGPSPSKGEMLSSRSFVKRVFADCCVNIPVGAHDISNEEDFFVALSRLMTSNLDVARWAVHLNSDYNNESLVYLEAEDLSVVKHLMHERAMLIKNNNYNAAVWFSHPVQLSARKRLLPALIKEFAGIVRICHPHIYPSWSDYCACMTRIGAVIEADTPSAGYVDGMCFVSVSGCIESIVGVNVHVNDKNQRIAFSYPQTIVSQSQITEVMKVIGSNLFNEYDVIGYVTIRFSAYCDSRDGLLRLWGQTIHLGLTPTFGAIGITGISAPHKGDLALPASCYPELNDRSFVYVPLAFHAPLRGARDVAFFHLAKMHRVVFDVESRQGVLFLMVDSIVSGYLSVLCVGSTRKKVLEQAVLALNFVVQQFGIDTSPPEDRSWDNLTDILRVFKLELKREKRGR